MVHYIKNLSITNLVKTKMKPETFLENLSTGFS